MKKILLTIGLATTISASALAQGSFVFSTAARAVWDDWSLVAPKATASNNVAFLIGTGESLVGAISDSTATNSMTPVDPVATWNAILNDPNYKLATNSSTGELAVDQTSTLGTVAYLNGNVFTVEGTSANGGSVSIFIIGWSYLYADPYLAMAAGSPVGWSSEFVYNYAAGPDPGPAGTPGNMNGLFTFGVSPVVVVPEPTTLALAGLGAASLLIFRRRKQ
jgi:hypothetical protein